MAHIDHDNLPSYESTREQSLPTYEPLQRNIAFPAQFFIYQKTGLVRPFTAFIGTEESSPLYHIDLGTVMLDPGQPNVVLHADASQDSPIVASVKAAPDGDRYQIQTGSSYPPNPEGLKVSSRRGSRKYTFSVENEAGENAKGQERQVFEWRPSRGKQVRSLGLRDYGWKLVRLSGSNSDASSTSSAEKADKVVAAWSKYSESGSKKIFGFRFFEESTSEDQRKGWEIMAVMTGLAIWHVDIMEGYMY
ncbi:hypothetical protein BKA67DRAFT_13252 [Truncatella angustata]|uniref:Uncharacterized protein n=1 Tax=Truncatella angustata TaxID=152316 RepID=A0A9P8UUJ7_9PEZI|nr:uncharacterized protein BKA67DRAFT_13252 [Truncatella angustata]KAH6659424.1 hypothetical protein BKA67DRAFT_13252 [Truncatella angustata]KAH8205570.1 hypothetical protein TruAng_000276 [Truncatella angustata]